MITLAIKKHIDALIATNRQMGIDIKRSDEVYGFCNQLTAINELRIESGIKFIYHV